MVGKGKNLRILITARITRQRGVRWISTCDGDTLEYSGEMSASSGVVGVIPVDKAAGPFDRALR